MRGEFNTYEEAFRRMIELKYPPVGLSPRRLPVKCEIRRTTRGAYQLVEVD